jgi:methylation protein EvaC
MKESISSIENHTCKLCDESTLRPFLDLGTMPIANAFLSSEQLSEPEYTFNLIAGFCETCFMVQLIETVDPNLLFHDNYAYFSSISHVMDQHFADLADIISNEIFYDDKLSVIEIGSNDGILLEKISGYSSNTIGIEPSANVAAVARSKSLEVISEFFNEGLAGKIFSDYSAAQLVVGSNVLCHIPDLNELARALNVVLDDEGVFIFEDPYLLDIVSKLAYDQIYDEHFYYFTITSLSTLFERHGLRIFRVEQISVHGGSMRIYGCKSESSRSTEDSVVNQLQKESDNGLSHLDSYVAFADNVKKSRSSLVDLLGNLQNEGKRIVGYAASSKGTVILNYCGVGADILEYVCDNTPSKQGLYTPGTHIPIVSIDTFASDYPDYAFVLAWNHMKEISDKEKEFRSKGGRFITHIPEARIV